MHPHTARVQSSKQEGVDVTINGLPFHIGALLCIEPLFSILEVKIWQQKNGMPQAAAESLVPSLYQAPVLLVEMTRNTFASIK